MSWEPPRGSLQGWGWASVDLERPAPVFLPPAETLGALASVLSIWIVTGVLVYLASARIVSNDYEIEASAMLGTSACAVGVNIM